ncbi:MAG: serine/threonine-protein kinase, partial [Gammaproteobacteria bacterium]
MQGLSPGLTVSDRFNLVRRLGAGGMGEVWLAQDSELDDAVALKILDPQYSTATEYVDLLRQECSRARALVHPNIVRVFDFHSADDRYCISMQFIDGETLVASRGAAFQTIVHQALMVCDALAFAHRAGIVHRDIKSSNVLVDARGVCYLTDFGLASAASTRSGDDVAEVMGGGTLPAMSPQQLAGAPAAVADDVYALGALLYELLSGAPLFHPDVTPARIRAEQPERLTSDGTGQALPDSLGNLVGAMLAKSPEQRPAGIGAVRSVLEEVQADFPRDVADAGDAGDVIQPISRRRPGAAQAAPTPSAPARKQPADRAVGLPPAVVYGGLAFLLAIAIVVIFLLPDAVDERRSRAAQEADDTAEPAPPPELEPAAPSPAALAVKREIADEILGELLVVEDRLKAVGVAVWGGTDWSDVTGIVAAGDDAYQGRRYEDAVTAYRDALNRMKILEPRAEQILAQALADGGAAIDAGDAPVAVRNFELALAVDAVNAEARAG